MDPMSRASPGLNPASTPFFPGGMRAGEEDASRFRGAGLPFRVPGAPRDAQFSSSSLSISPSEYRSIKSSPSPPSLDERGRLSAGPPFTLNEGVRFSPAPVGTPREVERTSFFDPGLVGNVGNGHGNPGNNRGGGQAESKSQSIDSTPDGEETTPGPAYSGQLAPGGAFHSGLIGINRASIRMDSSLDSGGPRPSVIQAPFTSSSPSSSLDSGSQFAPSVDLSSAFDAQLRNSPLIREILDRLVHCEYTTREIQRDLSDVNRKVDLLVERALNGTTNTNGPPEFKDPFAPNPVSAANPNGMLSAGLSQQVRQSFSAGIAPNQSAPGDDISSISNRLNTLTTSVGQLLALQTQQMHVAAGLQNPPLLNAGLPQGDLSSNQALAPPLGGSLGNLHGRGDMRAGPRMPNPPMRTWSAGNLDIPMRNTDSPAGMLGRQDSIFRDKRRSVSGLLRRDSVGGESLAGGSNRDGGPMVTKWEQLSLAPDLLRSLNTFGVGPPNKIQQRALPFLLRGADIIAQAPPTQERIAAYVIPAIHIALTHSSPTRPIRGPIVVMVSTTVDQATQAQRMIRDYGGPIGIKSALGVGATSANSDLSQEIRILQQNVPHIICGTPQKLHALFTSPGGMSGVEVRFLVLDEVDQLIARNLHEFVFNIIKQLPPPRSRSLGTSPTGGPGSAGSSSFQNFDNGSTSSLLPPLQNPARRFSGVGSTPEDLFGGAGSPIERQTALFSNTVPQDVLNLASAIQLREPVRVLVRRDGNVTQADTSQGARGLRQFYLYLAFTAGGRSEVPMPSGGLGIIGSGRGASSAETAQAREWKLDALADIFDDVDVTQAIIHVGGMTALDSVVYKLATRGLEAIHLHGDMNPGTKLAALNKFRSPGNGLMRQQATKVLVVYDVQVKTPEVSQIPLIINYDLPKAVEEYAHRVAPAIAPSYSRAGVVVNFVTATGGDVEMLRSIECFYKIKCPEVPMTLRDIV